MNPSTKKFQHYPIKANQVVNVPQGWWHYIKGDAAKTKILGIFSALVPKVILGSNIFNGKPADIMEKAYCVDEKKWEKAITAMTPSVFSGLPRNYKHGYNQEEYQRPRFPRPHHDQWNPYSYQ